MLPRLSLADALLVLWLRGSREAFDSLVDELRRAGVRFAAGLMGGPDVCLAGESAEDIVGRALLEMLPDLTSGKVEPIAVVSYFFQKIRWRVLDLRRKAGRQVPLEAGEPGDGEHSAACEPADADPSPEARLLQREWMAEARRAARGRERVHAAKRRQVIIDWCAWTATMIRECENCRALQVLLQQARGYLRARIMEAVPGGFEPRGLPLVALAGAVDPARVAMSSASLNLHLIGLRDRRGLARTRNAVDLAWTRIRKRSRRACVPIPAPLGMPVGGWSDVIAPSLPALQPGSPACRGSMSPVRRAAG